MHKGKSKTYLKSQNIETPKEKKYTEKLKYPVPQIIASLI